MLTRLANAVRDYFVWPLLLPLQVLLFEHWQEALRLPTLRDLRNRLVASLCRPPLLDVGSGPGSLVARTGFGIATDVFPWKGVHVLCDAAALPFPGTSFQTVAFVASLNHVPHRQLALDEARRVLRQDGRLIITMIGPVTGLLCHAANRHRDADQRIRGISPGESWGLTIENVRSLVAKAGFVVEREEGFGAWRLNRLFLAVPRRDYG